MSDLIDRIPNARAVHPSISTREEGFSSILILYVMAMMIPPVLNHSADFRTEGDHPLPFLPVLEGVSDSGL